MAKCLIKFMNLKLCDLGNVCSLMHLYLISNPLADNWLWGMQTERVGKVSLSSQVSLKQNCLRSIPFSRILRSPDARLSWKGHLPLCPRCLTISSILWWVLKAELNKIRNKKTEKNLRQLKYVFLPHFYIFYLKMQKKADKCVVKWITHFFSYLEKN